MGKITLSNHQGQTRVEFPKELIFLFKESKVRNFKVSLNYDLITERVNGKAKLHLAERTAYSVEALEVLKG